MNDILSYIVLFLLLVIILLCFNRINYRQFKENFTDFLDDLSKIMEPKYSVTDLYKPVPKAEEKKNNTDTKPKKELKYIYVVSNKVINNVYPGDIKYQFYDNSRNTYMVLKGNLKNKSEIKLFDIKNNIVGGLLYERYNNFIFYENDKNVNIEFYNNYKNVKLYLDNDDKEFYINKNKSNPKLYDIYLFDKNIGKIIEGKIMVNSDYEKYLNSYGIAYILFENY
jgi:hypothetical protein